MTNKTGPAESQGQPTQLTADEARDLDRLINHLSATGWESGFQDGLDTHRFGADRDEAGRAKAKADREEAYEAIKAWVFEHAPKPETSWREVSA